jgi:transcription antitermination factor NusG
MAEPFSVIEASEFLQKPFSSAAWYAVHTMPRHEKKVFADLKAKEICSFLPLLSQRKKWSDRYRIVEEPVFAGYVFVRLEWTSPSRIALLGTKGVVSFVGVRGVGTPIPESEINAIQQVLHRGVPFTERPFLKVGQRVRIRGGALDGLEGILQSLRDEKSLVVSIESIQRSISITLSGYEVDPLPEKVPGSSRLN